MPKKAKKEMIRTPKGMHDVLHGDLRYIEKIFEKAKSIAEFYGFLPIETPHLEFADLFLRPLGETSDVVEKEMYTFRSRGGDFLALRPEGTAPAVRAYFENGMVSWPQPVKLYYCGSLFRHEKPQRGRFREHRQFGLEALGESDPIIDAIVIKILYLTLKELGFENVIIHMNSLGDKECRPAYKKELVAYYKKKFNYLCKDCKRRLKENPLRLLDCKEEGCVELRPQAPKIIDHLCENCKSHFKGVLEFLDEGQIPYFLDHYLARGFDYYGRTVFEIFLEEGKKSAENTEDPAKKNDGNQSEENSSPLALGGGGRYDELAAILGAKSLPAVGGGLGLERVLQEMKRLNLPAKKVPPPKVFLVQIGLAAKKRSFRLMEELREAGIQVGESLTRDNLKTQLNIAAKIGAKLALIIGQKEAMEGSVIMRNMHEGTQEIVQQNKLLERIKIELKK
ncbi:MAG: histidine--tRNA ligase [bacterium]|nr:histidine--tRNA ligase [bacterium]